MGSLVPSFFILTYLLPGLADRVERARAHTWVVDSPEACLGGVGGIQCVEPWLRVASCFGSFADDEKPKGIVHRLAA